MALPTTGLFDRSTYNPQTQQSSALFGAAAEQVRANFAADQLSQKHSSGKMNDKQYINGLKRLTNEYRKGTGLRRGLRAETIGAAQTVADNYSAQINENQTQLADQALQRWNQASTDFAEGRITALQYQDEHDLYNASITGNRKLPTVRKTTQQVLGGKFWDQYKSGRVRNAMREKQVRSLYKEIYGNKIGNKQLKNLAGSEANMSYIGQQLRTNKGIPRDLNKEQSALGTLIKRLGRLPTAEEINTEVYG